MSLILPKMYPLSLFIHDNIQPTIGIDFISKNIAVQGKMIRLQLWDTAGQERFKSLIPSYLKDANMALVVFDLSGIFSVYHRFNNSNVIC